MFPRVFPTSREALGSWRLNQRIAVAGTSSWQWTVLFKRENHSSRPGSDEVEQEMVQEFQIPFGYSHLFIRLDRERGSIPRERNWIDSYPDWGKDFHTTLNNLWLYQIYRQYLHLIGLNICMYHNTFAWDGKKGLVSDRSFNYRLSVTVLAPSTKFIQHSFPSQAVPDSDYPHEGIC